uniref:Uncharacterized protein n=1 Tax=Anguilla anguilla TaxID=7936 RepID=A0A0E9S0L4_ANGAN
MPSPSTTSWILSLPFNTTGKGQMRAMSLDVHHVPRQRTQHQFP